MLSNRQDSVHAVYGRALERVAELSVVLKKQLSLFVHQETRLVRNDVVSHSAVTHTSVSTCKGTEFSNILIS